MIWELLSEGQKEEVKEVVRSSGFEIGDVYVQRGENTKEPLVLDSEGNLVDGIQEIIEEIYLRDLVND
jgi:hypothetical protein